MDGFSMDFSICRGSGNKLLQMSRQDCTGNNCIITITSFGSAFLGMPQGRTKVKTTTCVFHHIKETFSLTNICKAIAKLFWVIAH